MNQSEDQGALAFYFNGQNGGPLIKSRLPEEVHQHRFLYFFSDGSMPREGLPTLFRGRDRLPIQPGGQVGWRELLVRQEVDDEAVMVDNPARVVSLEERVEAYEDWLLLEDFQDPSNLPEKEYEQIVVDQDIQQALNQSDMDQRAVAVLIDLQDMDYLEAAQILGIPLGTVKSYLTRACLHLRHLLNAEKEG